jgi:hypothetical protein
MDRQPAAPPDPLGARVLEAVGWGAVSAFLVTIVGAVALSTGSRLYPPRYAQFPEGCVILPLAVMGGFMAAAIFRVARAGSTPADMWLVIMVLVLAFAGLILKFTHDHVRHANVKVVLSPEHVEAMPCSVPLCPRAAPPWTWTIRGNATLQERADMAARIESIEIVGEEPRGHRLPMIRAASVRYGADEIERMLGSSQLPAKGALSFPLQYNYVTVGGGSRIYVSVYVVTTDAMGKRETWESSWNVR